MNESERQAPLPQVQAKTKAALWLTIVCGAFIVWFFSPFANLLSFSGAPCIVSFLPFVAVIALFGRGLITILRSYELLLLFGFILFAALNTYFSLDPSMSLRSMLPFLGTGVFTTWASLILFENHENDEIFYTFCFALLIVFITTELYSSGADHTISLSMGYLTGNPIPLGSMLLLLLPGPLYYLRTSDQGAVKATALLTILLAFLVILLTQRRGILLGIAAMVACWIIAERSRWAIAVGILLVLAAVFLPLRQTWNILSLDPAKAHHRTVLTRLELYSFAAHVFQDRPAIGTGLRSYKLDTYLHDYEPRRRDLITFPSEVRAIQTFDNMYVTAFVEMGSAAAVFYFGFIGAMLYRIKKRMVQENAWWHMQLTLFPLIGFAVFSLTCDSLLFVPVNWLFHMHLGRLAAGIPNLDS